MVVPCSAARPQSATAPSLRSSPTRYPSATTQPRLLYRAPARPHRSLDQLLYSVTLLDKLPVWRFFLLCALPFPPLSRLRSCDLDLNAASRGQSSTRSLRDDQRAKSKRVQFPVSHPTFEPPRWHRSSQVQQTQVVSRTRDSCQRAQRPQSRLPQ